MKVQELLTDESKWTRRAYARNRWGHVTGVRENDAVCWCLFGAVEKCYGWTVEGLRARKNIEGVLAELGYDSIAQFNDGPWTLFKDIQSVVKQAGV
jgi:hypothetical protein